MNPLYGDISKRVAVHDNRQLEIINFGFDNLYPQLVKLAIDSSGRAFSCVKTLAEYVQGLGFSNVALNDAVVNAQGELLYDVLSKIAWDYSYYGGRAYVVKYNLFGQVNEIYHMPFEYVRLGANDKKGMLAVHSDWAGETGKTPKKDQLEWYYPYDPSKAKEQIAAVGWNNYKGQLYYVSSEGYNKYGTAPIDPEIESCISDSLVKQFHFSGLATGFMDNVLIALEQTLDPATEQLYQAILASYQGAENTGKAMLLHGVPKEGLTVQNLNSSTQTNRYKETEESIRERIRQVFNIPRILLGDDSRGGLADQGNLLVESQKFYSKQTDQPRKLLSQDLEEIFASFYVDYGDDFTIQPLIATDTSDVENEQLLTAVLGDLTLNERRELVGYPAIADSGSSETILIERIGIGGAQALQGILADPTLSKQQKSNTLQILFGLTPEEALKIAGSDA